VEWKGCTPNIARSLNKLPKEALTWLVSNLPDCSLQECGSTEASMVSHITHIPCEHWTSSHPWIGKQVTVVFFLDKSNNNTIIRYLIKNLGLER
jgi:hypothetical protein